MNFKKSFCLFLFLISPFFLFSQETQEEQKDSSKLTFSVLIDKVMGIFEIDLKNTKISIFPIASLDPTSGLSFGIMPTITISPKKENDSGFYRPTSLISYFEYSTKKWMNIKSDLILYTKNGSEIKAVFEYTGAPNKFYGIGETQKVEPVSFNIKEFKIRGSYSKCFFSKLYVGALFDFSHTQTLSLGANENGLDIPLQKDPFLIRIGPQLSFDTRENINYPTKGVLVSTSYSYFPELTKNSYNFHRFELEAKAFKTFFKDLVWGVHFFSGHNNGDAPFYYMHQLGGKDRMRGISNKNKYINNNATYLQTEVRKHIWGRFGCVAFGGYGNTYTSFKDFNIHDSKFIYGAGLRFQISERDKLNLRIDYGRSNFKDSGIYITMKEAF